MMWALSKCSQILEKYSTKAEPHMKLCEKITISQKKNSSKQLQTTAITCIGTFISGIYVIWCRVTIYE